jgi:hypothetical protein
LVSEQDEQTTEDRAAFLRRLADAGALLPDHLSIGPDGKRLRSVARAETMADDLMRVRGTARLLHVLEVL